jgi:hypothetical protein
VRSPAYQAPCKRPLCLSITHKFYCDCCAEFDVGEAWQSAFRFPPLIPAAANSDSQGIPFLGWM